MVGCVGNVKVVPVLHGTARTWLGGTLGRSVHRGRVGGSRRWRRPVGGRRRFVGCSPPPGRTRTCAPGRARTCAPGRARTCAPGRARTCAPGRARTCAPNLALYDPKPAGRWHSVRGRRCARDDSARWVPAIGLTLGPTAVAGSSPGLEGICMCLAVNPSMVSILTTPNSGRRRRHLDVLGSDAVADEASGEMAQERSTPEETERERQVR
jgi:hypothetical protein